MTNVQKRPLLTCGVIALVATLLAVGGIALALWARANAVEAVEARNRADAVTFAHQFGYTPEREIGFRDECIYSGFERTCTIYVMFTSPLDKQAVQQVVDGFPRGPKTPSREPWGNLVSIIRIGSGRTIMETVPANFDPRSRANAWIWIPSDQQNRTVGVRLYEVPQDPRQYHIDGVLVRDNVLFVSLSPD